MTETETYYGEETPITRINQFVVWVDCQLDVNNRELIKDASGTFWLNICFLNSLAAGRLNFDENGYPVASGERSRDFIKRYQNRNRTHTTTKKETTMSQEQNAAALLRADTNTVQVRYNTSTNNKLYTYVTDLDLAEGDMVLVPTNQGGAESFVLAQVVTVDDDVEIEPKSSIKYKFVAQKLDLTAYTANMKRNEEIEAMVRDGYRKASRAAFAQAMVQGLAGDRATELQKLLG